MSGIIVYACRYQAHASANKASPRRAYGDGGFYSEFRIGWPPPVSDGLVRVLQPAADMSLRVKAESQLTVLPSNMPTFVLVIATPFAVIAVS
jgi:hypothetical protein